MKCCFEWIVQKAMEVVPGNYFESTVLVGNTMYPNTVGRDDFQLASLIKPGKRLAGFGRNQSYISAHLGLMEAAPSMWVAIEKLAEVSFRIDTDIILCPGLLASYLSLDIATDGGTKTHIPLDRSDVRIDWQSRGIFIVSIGRI